ncbi:MAG: FAD-dependent oxidoreductase, partial [Clostridiales bacterium]|nr:FAD-dependent oxidoreductase [Clostridiales bacterium]
MKDVVDFLGQFDRCLASEPAFCMAACPFHLDVREFTERVEQGRGRAAYSLYREATGFPGIVSRICERPCEKVCPMREKGGAIRLREIERAVCADAEGAIPESYNLPARGKCVAIIGAGLCGLGCALRLAQKKYDVEIFEARDAVCGTGWESKELLETAQSEIERQFKNETVTLHLNTCVEKREDLAGRGFDAVFVCTGEGGETFETKGTKGDGSSGSRDERGRFIRLETKGDGSSGSESKENHLAHSLYGEVGAVWLTGGALTGHTGSEALAHGLRAAAAIDAFLRTGNLVFPKDVRTTKMVLAPLKLERIPASFPEEIPVDETGAAAEAARCLRCRCDACMLYADLPA